MSLQFSIVVQSVWFSMIRFVSKIGVLLALCLSHVTSSPPLQLNDLRGFDDDASPLSNQRLFQSGNVRLPRDVLPLHYDWQLRPIVSLPLDNPEQFTAPGQVTIRLRCVNPKASITLHADDLEIDFSSITLTSGQTSIQIIGNSSDISVSTYTIVLGAVLQAGVEYDLSISYMANVADRLAGLYRSSYIDASGNRKWLATTQFQKLGARQALPCFDEPNFRSTFNITIGRPTTGGYHSLSNSALLRQEPIPGMDGWVWDVYERTVNMPSYLLALIVSDYESVLAPADLSSYTVKTWGPPTDTNNQTGEFSARAAAQILTYFENYFDSPYQFSKLDSAAIPDFAAGAMENWALNTYRTVLMLWFDGESTQFEQWRQAAVIAHEISHHWFGDLVTCDWWNDLWLNEGFARYLQFIGANIALPDHGILDRYTVDVIQLGMAYDAGRVTEPVHSNVTEEVVNQASRIIYEKAAALNRMVQSFLSEETFIRALRVYLDKYEYDNTVQDQLFAEWQAQANIDGTAPPHPVKDIMDSWTLKPRFPIVTVRRAANNIISLTQQVFLPLGSEINLDELWYVPISYATRRNPDFSSTNWAPKFWIDKYTLATSKIIEDSTDEWIVVNPDARYFYRVIYDTHFFSLILAQLDEQHDVLSTSTRSQLIDDYFQSAFAGFVNIENALNLTRFLDKEVENSVWTTTLSSINLGVIHRMLQDNSTIHAKLRSYLLTKLEPALDAIGWNEPASDRPVNIILRTQLLDYACALGSSRCEDVTREYLQQNQAVPADYQPMIYCKAMSLPDSSPNMTNRLLDEYSRANRVERFTVMINALGCNQDASGMLNYVVNTASILTGPHSVQLLQRIAANPANRFTVQMFLTGNLVTWPVEKLGLNSLSAIVQSIASVTNDPAAVAQIKALADTIATRHETLRPALETAKNTMDNNIQWMETYASRIDSWLSS